MTTHYDKPLTKLIEDRAKELGRPFRTKEMVEHIIESYPLFKRESVRNQIRDMALNVDEGTVPSIKPGFIERNASNRCLVRIRRGVYELHDADKHGNAANGRLLIR